MLTQLATLKARLAIDDTDVTKDDLLTSAIKAVSARFDKETNRILARTSNVTYEFRADDTEIIVPHYPIENVDFFGLKSNETDGFVTVEDVVYLIRNHCVISLAQQLGTWRQQANVSYTGGYVLPGTEPSPGQFALPADLEQAAVEQVAAWFLHRDKIGLELSWPKDGTYQRFSQLPLLPSVRTTLESYRRWTL
jgi:hypothetical protein